MSNHPIDKHATTPANTSSEPLPGDLLSAAMAELGTALMFFDEAEHLTGCTSATADILGLGELPARVNAKAIPGLGLLCRQSGLAGLCAKNPLSMPGPDGSRLQFRVARLPNAYVAQCVRLQAHDDLDFAAALAHFGRLPPPHKLYVLVVDDDEDSRYILINNLQASNACQYSVAVAGSAAKALAMLQQNSFDICITDYRLLDETAIELHEKSRAIPGAPPFIVVTNYPEDTLYAKLLNSGISDLISKAEITPELLSRSIRYAVQKVRLLNALTGSG